MISFLSLASFQTESKGGGDHGKKSEGVSRDRGTTCGRYLMS